MSEQHDFTTKITSLGFSEVPGDVTVFECTTCHEEIAFGRPSADTVLAELEAHRNTHPSLLTQCSECRALIKLNNRSSFGAIASIQRAHGCGGGLVAREWQ